MNKKALRVSDYLLHRWAVDLAVVWQVIVRDLGELKREVERICRRN